MDECTFEDALTGSVVTCGYPQLEATMVRSSEVSRGCSSLFFPGCSLINYGLPLVQAVYSTLTDAGCVDGVSLLCCGKILSYEPDGDRVRTAFESQLRDNLAAVDVKRIVAACPNCVMALRSALAADERTAGIEIVALPAVLADLGYRIDEDVARRMVAQETGLDPNKVKVCVHDSCPDRDTGEFADGLRRLLPDNLVVEAAHIRKRSYCCGSLLRAAGKPDAADTLAQRHGQEAQAACADAIITACVSCSFQLSVSQAVVPVFHYLELLYDWRIGWEGADLYMKLRFLFDDALGAVEATSGSRTFAALDAPASADVAGAAEGS